MKSALGWMVVFCAAVAPAWAGWVADAPEDGSASIRYSARPGEGHPTFAEAVKELAGRKRMDHFKSVQVFELLKDDGFQKELVAVMERDAPQEWKAALKSSGNMHNPALDPLWKRFKATVKSTPTVQQMNAALHPYGFAVTDVSFEKFQIENPKTNPRVYCFLWIEIGKATP